MAGYITFTVGPELTELISVRKHLSSTTEFIVDFARSLRNTGSDIVVESDLASVFGRSKLTDSISNDFRTATKATLKSTVSLNTDLEFHVGAGPTLKRAFNEAEYLRTVVQLSMLGYFCQHQVLGEMISQAMEARRKAKIPEASPSPGIEGITNTLNACCTQSSMFDWSYYSRKVEDRIRSEHPEWEFHKHHLQLSSTLLLSFMDFIPTVQSLPEDRKIVISNTCGCFLAVIWAHYLHGLRVELNLARGARVIFGGSGPPQVIVMAYASDYERSVIESTNWVFPVEPTVQLHEKDLDVVIIECRQKGDGITGRATDRHPLLGYGDRYLTRLFNRGLLVKDSNPAYDDTITFAIALALGSIHCMRRRLPKYLTDPGNQRKVLECNFAESYRIIDVCKLIFRNNVINVERVNQLTKTLMSMTTIDIDCLPLSFETIFKRYMLWKKLDRQELLDALIHLASIIVVFAHVYESAEMEENKPKDEVSSVSFASIPISMDRHIQYPFKKHIMNWRNDTQSDIPVEAHDIFHTLCVLLTDGGFTAHRYDSRSGDDAMMNGSFRGDPRSIDVTEVALHNDLCLLSDLGWSIYLGTLKADDDPAKLRAEFVHVHRGTPVNRATQEQKLLIRDSPEWMTQPWAMMSSDPKFPVSRAKFFRPERSAKASDGEIWWSVKKDYFELTTKVGVESLHSKDTDGAPHKQDFLLSPRGQFEALWNAELTSPCGEDCLPKAFNDKLGLYPDGQDVHAGSDVIVVGGWNPRPRYLDTHETVDGRILVLQTRGNRWVRWAALHSCHTYQREAAANDEEAVRRTMLVTDRCCESCALEQVTARTGSWVLIL